MKLVLHMVWYELKRLRWWVATGAALLLFLDAYGFAILAGLVNPTSPHFTQVVAGLEVLVGILIVLELIQGDPLVGTRQFWLTRPISGGRLLVAKALTAAVLLIGLPAAIGLPWWLTCGFGLREVLLAVLELALTALAIGLPSAVVSGFCDSRGRALLWGVLAVPLVIVGLFVSARLFQTPSQSGFELVPVGWIMGAVILAAASTTMFLRRRWLWSVAIIVAGIAGIAAMPRAWRAPVNVTRHARHPELASSITFQVAAVARPNPREKDRAWVWIGVSASDVPAGSALLGGTVKHTWSRAEGAELTRMATVMQDLTAANLAPLGLRVSPKLAARLSAMAEVNHRRGLPAIGGAAGDVMLTSFAPIPLSIAVQLEREPRGYRGEYTLRLAKPVLEFEVPIEAGATRYGRGFRCHVESVTEDLDRRPDEQVRVNLLEAEPDAFIAFPGTRVTESMPFHPYYAVINAATREADWIDAKPWRSVLINGVTLTWRQLTLYRTSVSNTLLGRVTFDEQTWFTREVTADPLRWKWLDERTRP